MPDEKTPTTPEELAAHNAEVARKVRDQDISGKPTATGEFGDAQTALDELASKVPEHKPEVVPPVEPKITEPKSGEPKTPEAKPTEPKIPEPKSTEPGAPTPEEAAINKRAEELFKSAPTLPPNASPKSAEAFSRIKIHAAQEISAREQEIEKLKQQVEAAKNPTTDQLEKDKELEELRQWRQKLDVDFDPKFKEHDKTISQQREFIYAQLSKSPVITPEVINQIKKYGGPDMIDMGKLLTSVKDPTIQRLVESKLADIEVAKYNREQAVTSAKTNLGQYLQERQTALAQAQTAELTATATALDGLLGKLDWFAEKPIVDGADEATKKEATEHNKFLTDLRTQVAEATKDNSPQMRAILITGMAQLFNLQRRVPALEAKLAASEKLAKEATDKYERIRNSSRSRLEESQASPNGGAAPPKAGVDVNQRPGDALDDIARRVMEEKARVANNK
jgi:hypothetical protein